MTAALTPRHEAPASAVDDLVDRFAVALKDKLHAAEAKYGHDDAWLRDDWLDDLKSKLRHHVFKGDPRDVAAYCAFAWHHGWSVGFDLNQGPPLSALDPFGDRGAARASLASHEAPAEGAGGLGSPSQWCDFLPEPSGPAEGAGEDSVVIDLEAVKRWIEQALPAGTNGATVQAIKLRQAIETLRARSSAPEAREGEAFPEIEPLFWAWLKERDLCPDGDVVEWQDIIVALDEHEIEIMAAPSADKLRIAVGALESTREDLLRFACARGSEWEGSLEELTEEVDQALAALKAEG